MMIDGTIGDKHEMEETLMFYRFSFGIKWNDPQGHNRLGIILINQGKLFEGITAFLRAISLSPGYAEAYHNLGNALAAQNEPEKALAAFEEAKKLNPTNETAHHMVNALSGRQSPYPPRNFVRKLFDQYAPFFERHLNALTYQAPENLKAALEKSCNINPFFHNAIDLGCGTGLSGLAFVCITERLSGIDISANMIEKAARKKIYDELITGDICQVLQSRHWQQYDLFIAVDVLAYIGRLEKLFRTVRNKATDSASFIFTTESCRGSDYLLMETGRYAHSRSYISKLCRRYDFILSSCEEIRIRKDRGKWIMGDAYVLYK
ncbi:MAG: tetratricopeptide repeat protein [Proteobacteria bacterium]|nr:tetratricopeptide repeat protein [Pseudomonadota bacterium]